MKETAVAPGPTGHMHRAAQQASATSRVQTDSRPPQTQPPRWPPCTRPGPLPASCSTGPPPGSQPAAALPTLPTYPHYILLVLPPKCTWKPARPYLPCTHGALQAMQRGHPLSLGRWPPFPFLCPCTPRSLLQSPTNALRSPTRPVCPIVYPPCCYSPARILSQATLTSLPQTHSYLRAFVHAVPAA